MGKKLFVSLLVLILCLSLAACGQNDELESKDDEGLTAIESTNPDYGGESSESTEAESFIHEVDSCTFYTENNVDNFIDDGEFDFYLLMDFFGWTERYEDVSEYDGYFALPGPDCRVRHGVISLYDSDDSSVYSAVSIEYDNGGIYVEVPSDSGKMIRTTSGVEIPYSLCEFILYAVERIDADPSGALQDMEDLSLDSPEIFINVSR